MVCMEAMARDDLVGADDGREHVVERLGRGPSRSCSSSSSSARCPAPTGLGDVVARDRNGLILTDTNAGGESLIETGIRGVFAGGDVR
jgi:hypothetical protein